MPPGLPLPPASTDLPPRPWGSALPCPVPSASGRSPSATRLRRETSPGLVPCSGVGSAVPKEPVSRLERWRGLETLGPHRCQAARRVLGGPQGSLRLRDQLRSFSAIVPRWSLCHIAPLRTSVPGCSRRLKSGWASSPRGQVLSRRAVAGVCLRSCRVSPSPPQDTGLGVRKSLGMEAGNWVSAGAQLPAIQFWASVFFAVN